MKWTQNICYFIRNVVFVSVYENCSIIKNTFCVVDSLFQPSSYTPFYQNEKFPHTCLSLSWGILVSTLSGKGFTSSGFSLILSMIKSRTTMMPSTDPVIRHARSVVPGEEEITFYFLISFYFHIIIVHHSPLIVYCRDFSVETTVLRRLDFSLERIPGPLYHSG